MIRKITLAALLLICGSGAANAANTCSLSATGITFGVFSGSQTTTVGSVTIHCTGNGTVNFTLTLSTGSSGTYSSRQMTNNANRLAYNLHPDGGFTLIWGDGTGGSTTVSGKLTAPANFLVPIYGKVPSQTIPPADTYSDTIIATLDCPGNSCNTATTSFLVTANVQTNCTIAATNLVFGDYTQVQLNGQSQISLACTNAAPWNVGLNQGTFPGATVTTRRMTGPGSSSLLYFLYRDAAHGLNWGNTIGTDTVSGTGTGTVQTLTVYGGIPASQAAGPGGYQDTIIATITF